MRRATFLLRMLICVGALLLLRPSPREDRGYAQGEGSCIQPMQEQGQCPSGCTVGSFGTYTTTPATNGTFYLDYQQAPCGTAKQGETCKPPLQYYPVGDFKHCCAQLGTHCVPGPQGGYMSCCDDSNTCMGSGNTVCCLPDGSSCAGNDAYCCSGYCSPVTGTCCPSTCPMPACSNVDGYCWLNCGCPYSNSCSDCYSACVTEMTSGCESACKACDVCC